MAGVDVRCLGTGDAFGSGGRLPTATLLSASEGRLLVDCGPATLPALRGAAVRPDTIDAILLTHLHGDHFGGVPFFLMDAHYATERARPLVIAGPPGVEDGVARALAEGCGRPAAFLTTKVLSDGVDMSARSIKGPEAPELPPPSHSGSVAGPC